MSVPRRGFILIAVVFALVLLAALVAGGFFATLQDLRVGRTASAQLRDRLAAKAAVAALIGGWDPRALDSLAIGDTVVTTAAPVPGSFVVTTARRLSDRLFALRARATDSSGVTQSLETVVRLRAIELLPLATVRARFVDPILVASVSGIDQPPPNWTCPSATDTIAPLITQPTASDSAFLQFGGWSWAQIVGWVSSIPAGGDSIQVQYAPGDLAISGSRLRGLVVVEGNLTLAGGAEVDGVALVRGAIRFGPGGAVLRGSFVASQLVATGGFTPSAPLLSYSSCASLAAILSRALPEQLQGMGMAPGY